MALPGKVAVKISSEAAGYVSLAPVERRELNLAELVEQILGVTGKRIDRIQGVLARGSLVAGNSRFRWEPLDANLPELEGFLEGFPDDNPDRPFDREQCSLVILRGRRGDLELSRETASQRRLFKKQSFWDILVPTLAAASPQYAHYSYSLRADLYEVALPPGTVEDLQTNSRLLKYRGIAQQIHALEPHTAQLLVAR